MVAYCLNVLDGLRSRTSVAGPTLNSLGYLSFGLEVAMVL